jgi:hypothetical protein
MARPMKLTATVRETICGAVERGATFETACEANRIAASTGWEWLSRGMGRDPDRPSTPEFAEFAEALTRARAKAEQREVELILKAAEDDWRAAAWMLERRNPARYGRNPVQRVEVALEHGTKPRGVNLHDVLRVAREQGLLE